MAYLEEAARLPEKQERQMVLQLLFRWYLMIEGKEEARLSPEELQVWRGRFYAIVPEFLRGDFPWEVPAPLAPRLPEGPTYPRYHTPFRQYGFIAARVVDSLSSTEAPPEVLAVFMQGLMQILQSHGERVSVEMLARHLSDLSGGHLRVSEEVVGLVSRVVLAEGGRASAPAQGTRSRGRSSKGHRFHRGRRR